MTDFTVRVELHNASSEDYNLLHQRMAAKGYSREIVARTGVKYSLPSAEYVTSKNLTVVQVCDEVAVVAASIKPKPSIFVTQSAGTAFRLIPA